MTPTNPTAASDSSQPAATDSSAAKVRLRGPEFRGAVQALRNRLASLPASLQD